MAIAKVGTDSITTVSGTDTHTVSHTLDAAADLLLVRVSWEGPSAAAAIAGITWNGVALTRVQSGTTRGGCIAYLVNPATGTQDLVISHGAITTIRRVIQGYSGVDTAAVAEDTDSVAPTGAGSVSLTLTTSADSRLVDQLMLRTDRTEAIGANQTSEDNNTFTTGRSSSSSWQSGADGGVMSWSWNSTSDVFYVAMSIKATASGITGTGAATLPAFTASGAGTVQVRGTAAVSLPALTSAGAGVVSVVGTGAATLPLFSIAAAGVVYTQLAAPVYSEPTDGGNFADPWRIVVAAEATPPVADFTWSDETYTGPTADFTWSDS